MIQFKHAGLLIAIVTGLASLAHAQDAYPSDPMKLYEMAKQEGTLIWYVSGPLEAMHAIALDFQENYPGINVTVQRYVGVAQYQRFIMETQAKQNIADILSISDQPSVADLAAQGLIVEWKVPNFDQISSDMRIAH